MSSEFATAFILALLSSSVIAAFVGWMKDARKIKTDINSLSITTGIALMEKLQEELDRAEQRIVRLEKQLEAALFELEEARRTIVQIQSMRNREKNK